MEIESYHSVGQNETRDEWKVRSVFRLKLDVSSAGYSFLTFILFFVFAELNIQHGSLEKSENLQRHRTEGFGSTAALVVRRGGPFRVTLQLEGRPFNPKTDALRIKLSQGTRGFSCLQAGGAGIFLSLIVVPHSRAALHGDAGRLLQEGVLPPLAGLPRAAGPGSPQTLRVHLLSSLGLSGRLQVGAVCVQTGQVEEMPEREIHPSLQSLVSR